MAKETKSNKDLKNKKHFFKDFKAELKKVIWPTPKQVVNNTIAVVVIVLITAAIVFVLDVCFDKINSFGIDKLKEAVQSEQTVNEEVENQESAEENSENSESSEEANEQTDSEEDTTTESETQGE